MGHTVDAKVETRLPPAKKSGPHLLQKFALDNGEVEWWSFQCENYTCQPTLTKGKPTPDFLKHWNAARKL
jgi:hypothetical protein